MSSMDSIWLSVKLLCSFHMILSFACYVKSKLKSFHISELSAKCPSVDKAVLRILFLNSYVTRQILTTSSGIPGTCSGVTTIIFGQGVSGSCGMLKIFSRALNMTVIHLWYVAWNQNLARTFPGLAKMQLLCSRKLHGRLNETFKVELKGACLKVKMDLLTTLI